MKLKSILPDKKVHITYRTIGSNNEDMLYGECEWDGEKLIPLDGDSYYPEDEISKYEQELNGDLIVWYDSEWKIG